MKYKKLTSVLLGSAVTAAMVLTPGAAASAQASATKAAATASAGAVVERDSVRCSKPSGKWANYSWGEGNTSVTIHFNNHCSHKVSVKIRFVAKSSVGDNGPKYRCMTVNAKTKGKKKFPARLYKAYSVTRVARCS
ncbi:hypothetical protein ABZ897_53375 [Nonomuraea sp. NPDC046802]|uniref:hypothetical protein n=1 Tax=Nonomuraea sp. NPDC046802 TaxID=3154919 RepID=UPI0033DEAF66